MRKSLSSAFDKLIGWDIPDGYVVAVNTPARFVVLLVTGMFVAISVILAIIGMFAQSSMLHVFAVSYTLILVVVAIMRYMGTNWRAKKSDFDDDTYNDWTDLE